MSKKNRNAGNNTAMTNPELKEEVLDNVVETQVDGDEGEEREIDMTGLTPEQIEMVQSVKRGPGRPKKIRPEDLINPVPDYQFRRFESWQITEILDECVHCSDPERVVAFLRSNLTETLVAVLRCIYDPKIRYNVDVSELDGPSASGFSPLFRTIRNIEMLVRNDENDDIDPHIRVRILRTMIQDTLTKDYPTLVKILKKHTIAGISKETAAKVCMRDF